jgi:hypothetical protein
VIAGRVVDDQGEPVENAAVQLFYSGVVAGHARITEASYASTNDRGEYRVWGIAGAAYYVGVTADPWYVRSGAFDQSSAQPAYAAVYYPGTTDVTRATPLKVQPGEEAHADFTLTPVAASAVTVNCDNDAAHADSPSPLRAGLALNVIAHGIGGIETILKERFGDCPLAVNGLLPGHYLLRLSDTESTIPRAAQRWIDVGAGDMTVSLSLHPAAAVRGKVAIKNAGARPGEMTVRLYRELDEWSDTVAVGADGTFSFPHIEPGKYQVYAFGPGYYTEAIRAGDVVLFGGVVNVEDGVESRLSIVVSNESGRMKGFATRDDQPIANMLVVLVPRNRANAYTNVGYQTDSDGSFDWSDIRAGDYLLFAVDDPTIAYADAAAVKLYLAQAKAIRIESGKVLEERVPVQAAVK